METLLLPFLNFVVLVGLVVYFVRKPIKNFVTGRHRTIRDTVREVRARLTKSQADFEEFSAKLNAVSAEEASIREQALREGREARDRVLQFAKDRAATLVGDAKESARHAATDLKAALRTDFVEKVVGRTEQILREKLTHDDSLRLRKEFRAQVETAK